MNIEWLSDARKIPDNVMTYIRIFAVRAIIDGHQSPETVSDVLGISRSSIYEWLKNFREDGYDALETKTAPGMEPIITSQMDEWLRDVVLSKNPTDYGYDTPLWTCDILAVLLKRFFGVSVIGATVNAHLRKMGLTAQKPRYRAREQDQDEVEYFLNDKYPRVKRFSEKKHAEIAFEDETGIHLDHHSGRTWGARGKTPEVIATAQRGRINILSIVTAEGKMQFSLKGENINSTVYIDFLKRLISGRKRMLILFVDRASFHHSERVKKFVRAHRNKIRIYFLPRYSPERNPTEQLWGEIKNNRIERQSIKNKADLKKQTFSTLRSVQHTISRILSFFQLPDTRYAGC